MNDQNRNWSSSHTWWIAATTAPNALRVASESRWSLKAMSRLMSPVEAYSHSGHGQMAPNLVAPQLKHNAQVMRSPLLCPTVEIGGGIFSLSRNPFCLSWSALPHQSRESRSRHKRWSRVAH